MISSWTESRPSAQQLQQLTPQQRLVLQQQMQNRQKNTGQDGQLANSNMGLSDRTHSQSQLSHQQQQQLLLQQQLKQARERPGGFSFATTSAEILKKFAKYPPHSHFTYMRIISGSTTPQTPT